MTSSANDHKTLTPSKPLPPKPKLQDIKFIDNIDRQLHEHENDAKYIESLENQLRMSFYRPRSDALQRANRLINRRRIETSIFGLNFKKMIEGIEEISPGISYNNFLAIYDYARIHRKHGMQNIALSLYARFLWQVLFNVSSHFQSNSLTKDEIKWRAEYAKAYLTEVAKKGGRYKHYAEKLLAALALAENQDIKKEIINKYILYDGCNRGHKIIDVVMYTLLAAVDNDKNSRTAISYCHTVMDALAKELSQVEGSLKLFDFLISHRPSATPVAVAPAAASADRKHSHAVVHAILKEPPSKAPSAACAPSTPATGELALTTAKAVGKAKELESSVKLAQFARFLEKTKNEPDPHASETTEGLLTGRIGNNDL